MKNFYVKIFTTTAAFCMLINLAYTQNDVETSATDNWVGYINWFDLSGAYVSGSGWGVADLKTTPDSASNTITLQPNFNTYANAVAGGVAGDIDYWTNSPDGGTTPGPTGNKLMDASAFVEPGSSYNGVDLTFRGSVSAYTLDTSIYTAKYFIKALDPGAGYSDALAGSGMMDLPMSGNFSVTIPGSSLPAGLIIQYGFNIFGINANPADEATLGSVVVTESVATSIEEQSQEDILMYPNPANEQLQVRTNEFIDELVVRDLSGKQILAMQAVGSSKVIDTSILPSGIYISEFRIGNKRVFKKFVIQ